MVKLQYLGHLMQRADSLVKILMVGKTEGRRRRGLQRMRRLDGISEHEFEQAPGGGEGQGRVLCCGPWGCKELGTTLLLNNHHPLQGVYSQI